MKTESSYCLGQSCTAEQILNSKSIVLDVTSLIGILAVLITNFSWPLERKRCCHLKSSAEFSPLWQLCKARLTCLFLLTSCRPLQTPFKWPPCQPGLRYCAFRTTYPVPLQKCWSLVSQESRIVARFSLHDMPGGRVSRLGGAFFLSREHHSLMTTKGYFLCSSLRYIFALSLVICLNLCQGGEQLLSSMQNSTEQSSPVVAGSSRGNWNEISSNRYEPSEWALQTYSPCWNGPVASERFHWCGKPMPRVRDMPFSKGGTIVNIINASAVGKVAASCENSRSAIIGRKGVIAVNKSLDC